LQSDHKAPATAGAFLFNWSPKERCKAE